mgnify:CR=1 FL=1
MKYMYSITYKKPNSAYNYSSWYGGDNEQEAISNCKKSVLAHHNKYEKEKILEEEISIVEVRKDGDYNYVLKQLQNDMS